MRRNSVFRSVNGASLQPTGFIKPFGNRADAGQISASSKRRRTATKDMLLDRADGERRAPADSAAHLVTWPLAAPLKKVLEDGRPVRHQAVHADFEEFRHLLFLVYRPDMDLYAPSMSS